MHYRPWSPYRQRRRQYQLRFRISVMWPDGKVFRINTQSILFVDPWGHSSAKTLTLCFMANNTKQWLNLCIANVKFILREMIHRFSYGKSLLQIHSKDRKKNLLCATSVDNQAEIPIWIRDDIWKCRHGFVLPLPLPIQRSGPPIFS